MVARPYGLRAAKHCLISTIARNVSPPIQF
jgi:hypothetical protein